MRLDAGCQTTAMGIMPHTDVERAIELALGLDIPFWPQLPKVSIREDMYVQASEGFPGITIDDVTGRLSLDTTGFLEELASYTEAMTWPDAFRLTPQYSMVYNRFLEKPLGSYHAIRGQQIGPVSFGFKVTDEEKKPIIYDEEIRTILFDFMQRKLNVQYRELKQRNASAFVWLDEPGLGWVFSGLTGYDDMIARKDFNSFLEGVEGPRALHLCANVNLQYLLSLGIDILSFDAYQLESMPKEYAGVVAGFLGNGSIISWGVVPVDSFGLATETADTLADRLSGYWEVVSAGSTISAEQIARQALIAPARCCLKDIGQVGAPGEVNRPADKARVVASEEQLVEQAFAMLAEISRKMKIRYNL